MVLEEAARAAEESQKAARVLTKKMTISIPTDLLDELRVMTAELPGKVMPSISGLIVDSTRAVVEVMREEYNEGKPFTSSHPVKVKPGRRAGS